jgi:hypothetical protein
MQVFGEMPTPRSEYENYCCGKLNAIQSSCVHGRSTNISEQLIDGIPQSYGFHNLNIQSVIRADGTEPNYFTLPMSYPLDRDVPEPLFDVSDDESDSSSTELVHLFTEEKQHESPQLVECFNKAE